MKSKSVISNKIAYNSNFGGFVLSKMAALRLLELGVQEMAEEIEYNDLYEKDGEGNYYWKLPRHDLRLIQVIEELEDEASGPFAELKIAVILGNQYKIDEYDGAESVLTPNDIDWIEI